MTIEVARCTFCGEPMPEGEQMFKFHGYSGDCPKPPLPRATFSREANRLLWGSDRAKIQVALFVTLPSGAHDTDFEDRMVQALNRGGFTEKQLERQPTERATE
jgi:hypothetical protein